MFNITSEVFRRMMNVIEALPIEERNMVLNRFCQKLSKSGYDMKMSRRGLVAELKGCEK